MSKNTCVRQTRALTDDYVVILALVVFALPENQRFSGALLKGLEQRYVENNGFEPLTPYLQSRCSSQLS